MCRPEAQKWHITEKDEYDSLMRNNTWVLVPQPTNRKIVQCCWVYVVKPDGGYKACLVAKGFTQIWGQDYHKTFSPVARLESVCCLLAHTALKDWEIEQMDVKTAFLLVECFAFLLYCYLNIFTMVTPIIILCIHTILYTIPLFSLILVPFYLPYSPSYIQLFIFSGHSHILDYSCLL